MDPTVCSLDEQLKAFVSRHSATFSSIVKGDLSYSAPSCDVTLLSNCCVLGLGWSTTKACAVLP